MDYLGQSATETAMAIFLVIIAIVVALAFLAMPISGNIAGIAITLPIAGWVILVLVVLFILYFAITNRK